MFLVRVGGRKVYNFLFENPLIYKLFSCMDFPKEFYHKYDTDKLKHEFQGI